MNFFKKPITGTTKNDIKMAKLSIKQEKKNEKYQEKQNNIEQAKILFQYTKNNIKRFKDVSIKLEQETSELLAKISKMNSQKLSLKEKSVLKKEKQLAISNLQYLYLIKDYFTLLEKLSNDIDLTDYQYLFINKFAPFFDGEKVLNNTLGTTQESVLDEFKDVGNQLLGAFGFNKKTSLFTFTSYLEKYNSDINNLIMPDISSLNFLIFSKHIDNKLETEAKINAFICVNCQNELSNNAKFCPKCGTKVETEIFKFCSDCGAKIHIDSQFCHQCGKKCL